MDHLPNEIVTNILEYVMVSPDPLLVEELSPRRKKEHQRLTYDSVENLQDTTLQPDLYLTNSHPIHKRDWRAAVGTCKLFRLHGIPAFFKMKTLAFSVRFYEQFTTGSLDTFSPEYVQAMLENTREIGLLGCHVSTPSPWSRLPKVVASFKRLRKLNISLGQKVEEGLHQIVTASKAERAPPDALTRTLRGVGMGKEIQVGLWQVPESSRQEELLSILSHNIYPFLEAKAKMLQARREREQASIGG